jgi:hypothetical protein
LFGVTNGGYMDTNIKKIAIKKHGKSVAGMVSAH